MKDATDSEQAKEKNCQGIKPNMTIKEKGQFVFDSKPEILPKTKVKMAVIKMGLANSHANPA